MVEPGSRIRRDPTLEESQTHLDGQGDEPCGLEFEVEGRMAKDPTLPPFRPEDNRPERPLPPVVSGGETRGSSSGVRSLAGAGREDERARAFGDRLGRDLERRLLEVLPQLERAPEEPARLLVEQRADLQAGRVAVLQHAAQVVHGQAGVDDVLDDQHVPSLDRCVEVLEDAHDPR